MDDVIKLVAIALVLGTLSPRVSLKGTVRSCETGPPGTLWPGAKVSAFDVRTNRKLLGHLRRMDSDTTDEMMTDFFARYDSVMTIIQKKHALSRSVADLKGRFTLTFPSTDSVLVYAYDELEDEPTFFTYQVLNGRRSKTIALHIHGNCRR